MVNLPVFIIGIGLAVVGVGILVRLVAAVDFFRRDAERKGLPTQMVTVGTVAIGALAFCAIGALLIVTGVTG